MSERSQATSIDEYIAEFPPDTQRVLQRMREIISSVAPEAVETISYAIPTFDLNGRHLVHFAGYAHHVGLYPTPSGMTAFAGELEPYRHGKGTARFALGAPLPEALIKRIVEFRVSEVTGPGA